MSYTLLSEEKPTARKDYRCIWCGEIIQKGEKYIREKSIYDGEFQDHKWHPECEKSCQNEHSGEWGYEFDPYDNERPNVNTDNANMRDSESAAVQNSSR